jgi:hypothetical protein
MLPYRIFALTFLVPSIACAHVDSRDVACDILKSAAVLNHFAAHDVPPGTYRCDTSPPTSGYYVIGLHYNYHAPPGWVGSNLVGWYAVAQSDGKVYQWDINNNIVIGSPIPSE